MPSMPEKNETIDELTERLTELEIRYAYQVRLLDELNEVVTESGRRLNALEQENRRLRETLSRLAPEPIESPDE
jgi:uncharacterized coiled-coil protein SlyX